MNRLGPHILTALESGQKAALATIVSLSGSAPAENKPGSMMVQRHNVAANIDWISIILWLFIMGFGWMNIYSANILERLA